MKITHRTCLRLLLPVLILLVQGCSSVTTYPSNWAPVSVQIPSTCAAIAGDYKNRGIKVRDGGYIYDAYLQGEFLSDPSPVTLKTHITTAQDAGEKLTVEYWLGEKRLREREYTCIDGIPVNEYSSVPGSGMLGVSKVIERLFLADDGALIEFTSMDTKGISIVVLPLVDHQDWWTRFEAYDGGGDERADHGADIVAALSSDYLAYESANENNIAFTIISEDATAWPAAPSDIAINFYGIADECRQRRRDALYAAADGRPTYLKVEAGVEVAFESVWRDRRSPNDRDIVISKFTPFESTRYVVTYIRSGRGFEMTLNEVNNDETLSVSTLTHYGFTRPWGGMDTRYCEGNVTYQRE
jgi:hypothetical protein